MSFAVYEDQSAARHGVARWAGYAVPATCDASDCTQQIQRGMDEKCGEPFTDNLGRHVDGECMGCGLFFCGAHRFGNHEKAFPMPDSDEWKKHQLTCETWASWRQNNPESVVTLHAELRGEPHEQH